MPYILKRRYSIVIHGKLLKAKIVVMKLQRKTEERVLKVLKKNQYTRYLIVVIL